MPEVTEIERRRLAAWTVAGEAFVWERPLRAADLEALGPAAPTGPVLAAYVADLDVKEGRLAEDPKVLFTTPHFHGLRAVLVRLDVIGVPELGEVLRDAWLARAPQRLVKAYRSALL